MGIIVAIGGGEIGRKNKDGTFLPIETTKIDKRIIELSGKLHPKLLFLPTASSDSSSYCETIERHFSKRLGCKVSFLKLIADKPSKKKIEKVIFDADIIYVGGGNTFKMMRVWKRLGVDKMLLRAYKTNKVLCGLSAGSICWFKSGNSDSRRFKNPKADLIKVSGLGLINALNCPHYDVEKDRKPQLKKMMKKTTGVAIALDNCCAIEIIDDTYKIIASKQTANAYKVYYKRGKFVEEKLAKSKKYAKISDLTSK